MHAKPLDRIALIDECTRGDGIAEALVSAGYEVVSARMGQPLDGEELVVRVTSPGKSGIFNAPSSHAIVEPTRALPSDGTHADKMEAIARLSGGIAHDFNNILSVISICADDVLERLSPSDPNRMYLDDIRAAVERGASVTRSLLAFSRRDVEHARIVNVNDVVTSSLRTVERVLGEDIRLETTFAATDGCVRIDPSRWSSVFVNLALNARYAMPVGGTLSLRTRDTTLDPGARGRDKPEGRYVVIEVEDTGSGMTSEVLTRVFEPFFTTKGLGKATGLGLSVVHGVVEQSGGWIEVASTVGAGTTFGIYLPAARETPTAALREPRVVSKHREATVLVVEDEDVVRRVAVRALERSGYRVFQAASAEDALALRENMGPIDLLVTDIVLPGMDGGRLADALAKRDPNLAVLYTSGYTDDGVLREGIARSEASFLQKPYSMNLLLERVETLLERVETLLGRVKPLV